MIARAMVNRRRLVLSAGCAAAGLIGPVARAAVADPYANSSWRKVTDAEWKKRLAPAAFEVMRRDGTELPGSSPLLNEHRKGTFVCIGCGLPLFKSEWKFESGTGWPSFYTVFKQNIQTKADHELGYLRTEYHCAQCLGHQGHIFDDGPKPTGLRHCNDGVALKFMPA